MQSFKYNLTCRDRLVAKTGEDSWITRLEKRPCEDKIDCNREMWKSRLRNVLIVRFHQSIGRDGGSAVSEQFEAVLESNSMTRCFESPFRRFASMARSLTDAARFWISAARGTWRLPNVSYAYGNGPGIGQKRLDAVAHFRDQETYEPTKT